MKLGNAAKGVAFCGIFVAMFLGIQSIFLPKWPEETNKYPVFYDLEENTIDVLFLGTSHDYYSIYPLELYNNYGIRSFNLGSANQNLLISYYQLKDAYKTQKIKYVFLDLSNLFESNEESKLDETQRYKTLVSLPFSNNKVDLVNAYFKNKDEKAVLGYLFPLYRFHDRWGDLTKKDFNNTIEERYLITYGGIFHTEVNKYLGGSTQYRLREVEMTDEYEEIFLEKEDVQESKRTLLPEIESDAREYFDKIYQFCRDNAITLVPIKVPSIVTWGDAKNEVASEFLSKYELPLLDMTYFTTDINLDWSTDTVDRGNHLNFRGGLKVSNFIGKWILENCSGLRINEDFASKEQWDADAAAYEELKADLLLSMRTDTQKAHDLFAELSADQSKYILILSVKNDMSVLWNGKLEEDMRSIGLKEEFTNHGQQSYIAVIDRGENVFERFSPDSLIYKGTFEDDGIHSLYIKSENYKQGDSSRILIDGKEYSMNTPGLNIVVYDCEENRVVRQAAINLTVNPFKYYEK